MASPKNVLRVYGDRPSHWVGDGFPVHSMLMYSEMGADISPFLMLDYAGPVNVDPSDTPRGVDEHPHKGFETVTIDYQGELEHRDSAGNAGTIGPGDVQWMTAASGIVHEEKYSREFSRNGGTLEFIQLWVNLPAKDKEAAPGYQTLLRDDIPVVELPDGGGTVRVIAGEFGHAKGAARTFTPINVWDVRLRAGHRLDVATPDGHTLAVVVLKGSVKLNGGETVAAAELGLFERNGTDAFLEAVEDSVFVLLSGQPIDEPIAGYGPFVMNTQDEIRQAIVNYRNGKMGRIEAREKVA